MDHFQQAFAESTEQFQRLDRAIGAFGRLDLAAQRGHIPSVAVLVALRTVKKTAQLLQWYLLPELEHQDPILGEVAGAELDRKLTGVRSAASRLLGSAYNASCRV